MDSVWVLQGLLGGDDVGAGPQTTSGRGLKEPALFWEEGRSFVWEGIMRGGWRDRSKPIWERTLTLELCPVTQLGACEPENSKDRIGG